MRRLKDRNQRFLVSLFSLWEKGVRALPTSIIRLENVSYEYRQIQHDNTDVVTYEMALTHINLDILKGEYIAIIGRNGSGKSTMAKLMNGLFLPKEGHVYVNGLDTKDASCINEIRETAGMVFQNPDNQIVATIVEEDVAFGPENIGMPPAEIRKRVTESLKTVHMEEHRLSAPHMLSGGQKQRVAIAGVLAIRPQVIILDEPTAMLDPSGRREVMQTIEKLNCEGFTIVLITHFMEEAVRAERVVVLEDGQIVMDDKPRKVFSQMDRLNELGLDVPRMTELAHLLRKKGIDVPKDVLSVEEMVMHLCPS